MELTERETKNGAANTSNKNKTMTSMTTKRLTAFLMISVMAVFQQRSTSSKQSRDLNLVIESIQQQDQTSLQTPRYAVASYVEGYDQIYGVYSIRNQMAKFNMSDAGVTQVIVIPNNLNAKLQDVLKQWVGEQNVYPVDRRYILDRIGSNSELWKGVFSKLWIYNLTQFDKIVALDLDVLIRRNIMHWFDYDTPCGIQARGQLSWNSGAMVLTPDTAVFDRMVEMLPNVTRYDEELQKHLQQKTGKLAGSRDNWNPGYGQQGFLTSFFTQGLNSTKQRCVMPTEAAALSSSLKTDPEFGYFLRYRNHIFETIHFTKDKPWRSNTRPGDVAVCLMLAEWKESVAGVENFVKPIQNDFLANCPDATKTNSTRHLRLLAQSGEAQSSQKSRSE